MSPRNEREDTPALRRLLRTIFDRYALESFVQGHADGRDILDDIPENLGFAARVEAVLTAWQRRGMIDTSLFAALAEESPAHVDEIAAVAARWDVELERRAPIRLRPTPRRPLVALLERIFRSEDAQEHSNRREMLTRVRRFWLDGLLKHSLLAEVHLDLGLETAPDLLTFRWTSIIHHPIPRREVLPPGTSLTDVHAAHPGNLLIVGEPGSGKTTSLLQLAKVHLERAEQDPRAQLPVVFHLASWGLRAPGFRDWLVQEFAAAYFVPRPVARRWLDQGALLLFLDGLDEVPIRHRTRCVDEINKFFMDTGTPFVVGCRTSDYATIGRRLAADSAVSILPLSDEQITRYLGSYRPRCLPFDPELLRTPLMLSISALADKDDLPALDGEDERARLLRCYVDRMFVRRPAALQYPRTETLRWLTALASHMVREGVIMIRPETVQPRWLGGPARCGAYALLLCVAMGVLALGAFLASFQIYSMTMDWEHAVEAFDLGPPVAVFSAISLAILLSRRELLRIRPHSVATWSWKAWIKGVPAVASTAMLVALPLILIQLDITVTLAGYSFARARAYQLDVMLAGWKWIGMSMVGILQTTVLVLCIGLMFSPIKGLRVQSIDGDALRTDWWRHEITFALGASAAISMIPLLTAGCVFLYQREVESLALGSLLIGTLVATCTAAYFGGLGVILQHACMRLIGGVTRAFPWDLRRFFDQCVSLAIMRQVGPSYCFYHRAFLEYLADTDLVDRRVDPRLH